MKKIFQNKKRFTSVLLFSLIAVSFSASETGNPSESVKLTYNGGRNYTLVERTDLRRYDNGKYVGLVSREVRSFINGSPAPQNAPKGTTFYEGSFYVQEDTRRAMKNVADGLHDSIPAVFSITPNGNLMMIEDNGYPSFRSVPAFCAQDVRVNDKWQSKAERTVDPLNKGIPTRLPMFVEYTYLGDGVRGGEEVFVLRADWATQYSLKEMDPAGDVDLKAAFGKHSATMHISKATGYALVVRDSVDETFVYADGKQVAFKGTISLFTEYPPSVDHEKIESVINRIKAARDDVKVEETTAGIRLTMQNLKFKPNEAKLLPGEEKRLDSIAELLRQVPGSQFLVEGHTASTGNERAEQNLSEERAREIAFELAKRGIAADRFIVKGSGARKPVADNSTPEGKAHNRRVEITILE